MEARTFLEVLSVADLSTWTPNEYELNRKYAYDRVTFSDYMMQLRELIGQDTDKKLADGK